MLIFACSVHSLVASQIQIQNCTNVQAGKKYTEERSGREETADCSRAAAASSVQAEGKMDGRRRVGFLGTRDRGGPLGGLGGAWLDPRLRFQGSQPTAGKHSGLHLPLPSRWHYLNPASHSHSELAD